MVTYNSLTRSRLFFTFLFYPRFVRITERNSLGEEKATRRQHREQGEGGARAAAEAARRRKAQGRAGARGGGAHARREGEADFGMMCAIVAKCGL